MRKPLLSLVAVALVAAACGCAASSSGGYVAAARPPTPRPDGAAAARGRDALRRRHLRGPGHQPHHRHRRGPRLDLRHGRRHRLVHDRPALRRRWQPARSRQRPGRGMGQRLRSGLSGARRRHVRGPSSTAARRRSSTSASSCSGSGSRPAMRRAARGPMPPSRSSSTPRARWAARIASSSSRTRCGSSSLGLGRGDFDRRRHLRRRRPGRPASRRGPRTRTTILDAIDQLQPGGSTNLEAGLRLGYELARETLTEDGIDRVVLASDGVANVGLTDADGILRRISEDAAAGIELVSIGVGMGNYNDALLEQLADQGDGFYAYVNDLDEARRLFTEGLTGTLQTVALDAKVQVEFDPDVVADVPASATRTGRSPTTTSAIRRVDAGAIGAGHASPRCTCIRLRDDLVARRRLGVGPASLDRARGGSANRAGLGDHDRRPRALASGRPVRPSSSMPSSRRPRRSCATSP